MSLKILLKGQLEFINKSFDIIALSSDGQDLRELEKTQNVRIKAIEMTRQITPFKDLLSLSKMILFFIKEKPEIVHTHTPKAGLIGMLAAWITRVPFRLHTVAGLPLMESSGIKRKVLLFVEKGIYACATQIYPNSSGLKDFISSHNLTTPNKIKVLGNGSSNGINTTHFSRTDEVLEEGNKIRVHYKISAQQFVFIFVGRVVKDKGINELLACFDKLCSIEKDIKLLLVGPFEDDLDPISKTSRDILKSNEHIICVGYKDDIRPFLAISDCLVFPSYREGFPNVVMQAGSMELPSIVSNINGCNEIVKEGINGLIVPSKNRDALYTAMNKFLQDDQLTIALTKEARKLVIDRYDQQFVWNAIKKEYNSLLNDSFLIHE